MSVFPAAVVDAGNVVRGMPTRGTDLMELFQASIVQAIAAAAGCNVLESKIDDGIDLWITQQVDDDEEPTPLRLQLKAVTDGWNVSRDSIRAKMSRKRFNQMRQPGTYLPQILVIMDLPKDQDDWIRMEEPHTITQHLCYWNSLVGEPERPGTGDKVTVSAPVTNVFDDFALCEIMSRIRAEGTP